MVQGLLSSQRLDPDPYPAMLLLSRHMFDAPKGLYCSPNLGRSVLVPAYGDRGS